MKYLAMIINAQIMINLVILDLKVDLVKVLVARTFQDLGADLKIYLAHFLVVLKDSVIQTPHVKVTTFNIQ